MENEAKQRHKLEEEKERECQKEQEEIETIIQSYKEGKRIEDIVQVFKKTCVEKVLTEEYSTNVPIRLASDIPGFTEYDNYKVAKNLIVQYRLPYWLEKQLILLENSYKAFKNTNVQLSYTENDEFWKVYYQVRYFPRTLCETYFVFNEEFSNSHLNNQDEISILSIGCGSGGDIIGLLMALDSRLSKETSVSIVVYEVNDYAFGCLKNNLKLAMPSLSHIKTDIAKIIRNKTPIKIDGDFDEIQNKEYDYILCSKMVNEVMRTEFRDVVNNWNGQDILLDRIKELEQNRFFQIYLSLLGELKPHIKTEGYCLISELTDKPIPKELTRFDSFKFYCRDNDGYNILKDKEEKELRKIIEEELNKSIRFLPLYLNAGVKSFIKQNKDCRPVAPWFCDGCWTKEKCFTQLQFYIHNPLLSNPKDRFEGLCFRIIKKEQRTERNQNLPNAAISIKKNDGKKEFLIQMSQTSKNKTQEIVSAYER